MAARTMTIDQALKITKGLFELTQARGDGSLKFIFLQSSREKIGELFGEYYTEATNDLDTLIRILSDYVNKFPRVTGSSTFSKFDTNLGAKAPDAKEEDRDDPKLTAIHGLEGHPSEHLEAFRIYIRKLFLAGEFLAKKYTDGKEIIVIYRELLTKVRSLKSKRIQFGLFDIDIEELRQLARGLLTASDDWLDKLETFGKFRPESYFTNDASGVRYAQMLGFEEKQFSWTGLVEGVDRKEVLKICQAFDKTAFAEEQSIINLSELINTELNEVKNLKATNYNHLMSSCDELLSRNDHLETLSTEERLDFCNEITAIEKEIWRLKLSGDSVDEGLENKLSTLKQARAQARHLNEEDRTTTKSALKLEEALKLQRVKDTGVVKQKPLDGLKSWLSWLHWYQSLVRDIEIPDIKKLTLILGSLKDKEDKLRCQHQPLTTVEKFLREKYHKPSLIITSYMQEILSLPKPKTDEDMENNISRVLSIFDLLSFHKLLEFFDSGYIDNIMLHTFTEREMERFLRKKLEDTAADSPGLSSTRLEAEAAASLENTRIDQDLMMSTAEEKREYFMNYIRKKLNVLRHVKEEKQLLKQRAGVDREGGRKEKSEVKKTNLGARPKDKKQQPQGKKEERTQVNTSGQSSFTCLMPSCSRMHKTKFGKNTQSLAFCPDFLKASDKEKDAIASKIPDLCHVCLNKRTSHRGKPGCFITKPCWLCNKAGHSSLMCRTLTEEERRKKMESHQPYKRDTVKKVDMDDYSSGEDQEDDAEQETGATGEEEIKKAIFVKPEDNMDQKAIDYGFKVFETAGGPTQGATGEAQTPSGETLKCQFDTGSTVTLIKEATAQGLNLPVLKTEERLIKTLSGEKKVKAKLYLLKLIDNLGNERVIKALGMPTLGGNPVVQRELRLKLAEYFNIPKKDLATPDGELDLLIGMDGSSVMVEIEKKFKPPQNSPNIRICSSPIIAGYMYIGQVGLDRDL